MDSGMIGKIEKAKRYAMERNRFEFISFTVKIKGENNTHQVEFKENKWYCDCDFFQTRSYCTHTMALEEILKDMISPPG